MLAKTTKQNNPDSRDDQLYLMKFAVAIDLFRLGLTQSEIGKRLRLQKATVNNMLKGLNKKGNNDGQ